DGKFQLTVTELSPDGKTLAFTSSDAIDEVRLLDIATGKVRPALRGHTESVTARFAPDGKTIATITGNKGLKLWDAETGRNLERFNDLKLKNVYGATFSPDG